MLQEVSRQRKSKEQPRRERRAISATIHSNAIRHCRGVERRASLFCSPTSIRNAARGRWNYSTRGQKRGCQRASVFAYSVSSSYFAHRLGATSHTCTLAERLSYSTNSEAAQSTSLQSDGTGNRHTMASDEDYAAFLDKANADPNEGVSKTQSSGRIELKAVESGVKIPASLKKVTKDAFYTSDADEPFEPVGLKFEGKTLPDAGL